MAFRVFVYGTLKSGHGNNHLLEGHKFIGEARTDRADYALYSMGYIPFVAAGDKRIKGELWEVDVKGLKSLDGLEGHPRFYCREEVPVMGEPAWMYMIRDGQGDKRLIVEDNNVEEWNPEKIW